MAAAPAERYSFVLPTIHADEGFLQSIALRMKDLRLTSLKTDPESFSSTYAHESRQPLEFWIDRLLNPKARHLVMAQTGSKEAGSSVQTDLNPLNYDWIEVLVLLGPRAVDPDRFDNESALQISTSIARLSEDTHNLGRQSALAYYVAGVWVAPGCRRQGIGRRLVQKAIDEMKQDGKQRKKTRSICVIGADDKNFAAQNLYQTMGFDVVGESSIQTDDGRRLRELIMRHDLVHHDEG